MAEVTLVGIDEAGRGALAGPVVVCAVLGSSPRLSYAVDSKKISKEVRERLYERIIKDAGSFGVGMASNTYIDKYGLSKALTKAARQAFSQISYNNQNIIIDGNFDFLKVNSLAVKCLIKADSKVKQVSAASIIAKVYRDNYMRKQAKVYQDWDFEKHFGYGTAQHILKLENSQPTKLHRKSFKPLNATNKYRK